MRDQLQELMDSYKPDMLKNEFARLCYKTFIESEDGRSLMLMLIDTYINVPFTDVMNENAPLDSNQILAKTIRKDFLHMIMGIAQSYQSQLNETGEI